MVWLDLKRDILIFDNREDHKQAKQHFRRQLWSLSDSRDFMVFVKKHKSFVSNNFQSKQSIQKSYKNFLNSLILNL